MIRWLRELFGGRIEEHTWTEEERLAALEILNNQKPLVIESMKPLEFTPLQITAQPLRVEFTPLVIGQPTPPPNPRDAREAFERTFSELAAQEAAFIASLSRYDLPREMLERLTGIFTAQVDQLREQSRGIPLALG